MRVTDVVGDRPSPAQPKLGLLHGQAHLPWPDVAPVHLSALQKA